MRKLTKQIGITVLAVMLLLGGSLPVLGAETSVTQTDEPSNLLITPKMEAKSLLAAPESTVKLLQQRGFTVTENKETGAPRFLMGELSAELKTDNALMDYFALNKNVFGIVNPSKQLTLLKKDTDEAQSTHYLYQQQYQGIPIYGKYMRVHLDKGKQISSITNQLSASMENLSLDTNPDISGEQAIQSLKENLEQELGEAIQFGGKMGDREIPQPTTALIVYPYKGETHLAYEIKMAYAVPELGDWVGYVDAHTGKVVHTISGIHHAGSTTSDNIGYRGDNKRLNIYQVSANEYHLEDHTKPMAGIIQTFNYIRFGDNGNTVLYSDVKSSTPVFNSTPGTSVSHAVDAHYNTEIVYNYYKNELGRNSIDDAGMSITSFVHVPNSNGSAMENAFWSNRFQAMFYGDGNPGRCYTCALDVVAHEITHGVTAKTAGLVYENQPGALNESFSDMIGAVIDSDDWEMGENVGPGAGDSARDLANPHAYGQPAHMSEYLTLADNPGGDNGGVHINSGIPNHAAYLMATNIEGLGISGWNGRKLMGYLAYHVLKDHLTPVSEFEDARDAFVAAVSNWGIANNRVANIPAVQGAVIRAWGDVGLPYNGPDAPNTSNDIVSFSIPSLSNDLEYLTQIDLLNNAVIYRVPTGTPINSLSPTIRISTGATISPASGVAQNFTNPVTYKVTAENGVSRDWKIFIIQGNETIAPVFQKSTISRDNKTVTVDFSEYILDDWSESGGIKNIVRTIMLFDNAALTNGRALGSSDKAEVRDGKLIITFAQPIPGPMYIRMNVGTVRDLYGNLTTSPVGIGVLPAPTSNITATPGFVTISGLPGANISLYNAANDQLLQTLVADSMGNAFFMIPPTGTYYAKQSLSGFDSLTSSMIVITTTDTTPPSSVNFRMTEATANSVTLAWDAASDNVAVAGYQIVAFHNGEGTIEATAVPATTTSYKVQNLKPGRVYMFMVSATDTSGNRSQSGYILPIFTVDVTDQEKPTWSPVRYVALGDSLALGVTPQNGINKGYPNYIAEKLAGAGVLRVFNKNFPMFGYTTENVLRDIRSNVRGIGYLDNPANQPIQTELSQADIITIDAGANDLLQRDWRNDPIGTAAAIQQVSVNLSAIIDEIKARNANAQIYLMGYYNPFPRLPVAEKLKAIALVDALNNAIAGSATTANGATFVPTKNVIAANELEFIPNPLNIHLSLGGYQAIADQFWNALKDRLPQKGSMTASNVTQTSLTLQWSEALDNKGVNEYKIYKNGSLLQTVAGNILTYDVTGLTAGTEYTFKVEGGDVANHWTTDGPSVTAKTLDAPDTAPTWPANASLTASGVTQTGVTLTWTAASDDKGVAEYKIYKNGSLLHAVAGNTLTYNVGGLTAGTNYRFKVEAGDAVNHWTTDGPAISVITSPNPGGDGGQPQPDTQAPTWPVTKSLTASNVTQTGLTLTWTSASDNTAVTSYKIYNGDNLVATVTGSVYTQQISNLSANTQYAFKVEAGDAVGNWSTNGPAISVTTLANSGGGGGDPQPDTQAPTWPVTKSLTATNVTQTGLTLTWTPAIDNTAVTSYKLYNGNTLVATVTGSVYTQQLSDLTANTSYTFKVEAGDASGNWSTNGPSIRVTTLAYSGGGGGGGGYIAPDMEDTSTGIKALKGSFSLKTVTENGSTINKVEFDAGKWKQLLEKLAKKPSGSHEILFQTEEKGALSLLIPFSALTKEIQSVSDATLIIETPDSTYRIPLSSLAEAIKKSGISSTDDKALMRIMLVPADAQTVEQLDSKAWQTGASFVEVPDTIIVGIELNGSFKPLELTGNPEVFIDWKLKKSLDAGKAIVVIFDSSTGSFRYIASHFTNKDGKILAAIPVGTAGKPMILVVTKEFTDLKGHWSQADVEFLASRLLIEGVSSGTFAPDQSVTRSQFTALLVRALGLPATEAVNGEFADVLPIAWFASSVHAAVKAGLITGFEDGTFKPDAPITRSEMAVMIARVLKANGIDLKETNYEKLLSRFTDRSSIEKWSEAAVSLMLEAGLIQGLDGGKFAPNDLVTRAQAAVVLKRMLEYVQSHK
ncbi:fibronectin type III domain-containing protein [Paenibacillus sedimenti]|uniref:S-layer homology domain-containing protein n=1 Tax=Paenibacillus sedimenti TaxID=2770274 RepID=A0A926QK13_9BACL|nr:S-layer homology domain-containing protein [Paenibacillus sedimenti]MBD0382316.1 S-layer homology domain-containing protein [Paenibacillus sedimenti]